MESVHRIVLIVAGLIIATALAAPAAAQDKEKAKEKPKRALFEWRTYSFKSAEDHAVVDAYLEKALIPALKRMEIGPVGVFTELEPGETSHIYVLISYKTPTQFYSLTAKLNKDQEYKEAAAEYLKAPRDTPAYERMEVSLLRTFAAIPQVEVPAAAADNGPRIFELRIYESHSEQFGQRKVQMFNSAEIDLFRTCGIQPVFFGQAVTGDRMPNLTYMTVYKDMEARKAVWKKFLGHPEWDKLKNMARYKGTVSNISAVFLKPKPYSQI